ncbi:MULTISPECIES: DUF1289 domain-containing protein [unclassified Phenylobacterium]|uniref:DUF1289 domain-containing protein n=1 Tax=unclassified Phenylobacterium TaxID=2640670 RepID=UPI00083AF4CE|nr:MULTISPECIES: DUF1289 domain-containing protein [unclassified Phenylobacterium]
MTVSPARTGPPAPIKTPCIKVCVVDGESGLCLGCYRRLNEVAAWARLSEAEREAILAELPERRGLIRPEKLAMF